MSKLSYAERIIAAAYMGLVEDALKSKKDNKVKSTSLVCCKCGRSNVTLHKLHKDVYACPDCIRDRAVEEMRKDNPHVPISKELRGG